MRRTLIEELGGFNEELTIAGDYELVLRALHQSTLISDVEVGYFSVGGISTVRVNESLRQARQARISVLGMGAFAKTVDWLWYAYKIIRHQTRKLIDRMNA
jgi:hypothetical protein